MIKIREHIKYIIIIIIYREGKDPFNSIVGQENAKRQIVSSLNFWEKYINNRTSWYWKNNSSKKYSKTIARN